jgi:hypothetical protein
MKFRIVKTGGVTDASLMHHLLSKAAAAAYFHETVFFFLTFGVSNSMLVM